MKKIHPVILNFIKELGDYPNLISRDYENEPVINAIKKWINQREA